MSTELVEVASELADKLIQSEAICRRSARPLSEPGPGGGIVEKAAHGVAKGSDVTGRHHYPGSPVLDHPPQALSVGHHHCLPH